MDYLLCVLFSVCYGKVEQVLYDDPPYGGNFQPPDNNSLFGHFSKQYHIPMFALFALMAFACEMPLFLPGMFLIEDASYFFFSKQDTLSDISWVTGKLGGIRIKGQYIPSIYVFLFLLQAGLFLWRL